MCLAFWVYPPIEQQTTTVTHSFSGSRVPPCQAVTAVLRWAQDVTGGISSIIQLYDAMDQPKISDVISKSSKKLPLFHELG